jgi:murein DD-endopeptidase MepM/ murein hydrolase activator NlpD
MAAKPTCIRAGFTFALVWFFILLEMVFLAPAFSQACRSDPGWQSFERQVRDGEISFPEGKKAIAVWAERLEREFPEAHSEVKTFFPLMGYSLEDVGGKNGNGYKPEGYRFLDGNRHQGHPAQDIFVRDRDQDGIDDLTGKPVQVLALAEGVILSTFSGWERTNLFCGLRGGNYVWVYHPGLKALSYYAHLGKVFVHPGDKVRGGEALATLGRSGKNASLPCSPTHLHLMILSSETMEPLNPFPFLKSSRVPRSLQRRLLSDLHASARFK